jgi:hypothetical protein
MKRKSLFLLMAVVVAARGIIAEANSHQRKYRG